MSIRIASLLLLSGLAASAGCDSQAGTDYRGEPLALVLGTMTSEVDDAPAEMEALLLWNVEAGSEQDHVVTDRLQVSGGYPAEFGMELFDVPDDDALNQFGDESRFGVAYILALPAGYDLESDEAPAVMGAGSHVLAYVESDIEPGTTAERILGGALEAGYHLMTWLPAEDPACVTRHDGVYDCLLPEPEGFDAEVEVRITTSDGDADLPDWI